MEIESYRPLPKQKDFHRLPNKYKCFLGGFGAGKSVALVWEAIDLSMRYPGNFGLLTRKYNDDIKDTTRATFFEQCPKELILDVREGGNRVTFINGSNIVFCGLYTKAKTRISKLGSYNLGFFAIDEAYEASEEDFLMLQGRLRLVCAAKQYGFLSTNPPNTDHWIFRYFDNPTDTNYAKVVKCSSYDNPNLPADYIANLEKLPETWKKRFLYGEFGFLYYGLPVYANFDEKIHIKKLEWESGIIYRGWDFGWVKPAVIFLTFDNMGRIKIFQEYIGDKIYLKEFVPKVILFSNTKFPEAMFKDFCDAAGVQKTDKAEHTSIEILKEYHINPRYRKVSVLQGIEEIEKKFSLLIQGQPAIQVDPSCKYLIEGFQGGYHYPKDSQGHLDINPAKDGLYEHSQDAFRYIISNITMNVEREFGEEVKTEEPQWTFGQNLSQ